MEENDFLTWGERFGEIMSPFSKNTRFTTTGRLGEVRRDGTHRDITFIMQAPVFVSCDLYRSQFIELIKAAAERFHDRKIVVRPHPEYEEVDIIGKINGGKNIVADCNNLASESLRDSIVAVSHFSTCLVEAPLFGCEPVVFNPTYDFCYELVGSNRIGRNREECIEIIQKIINNEETEPTVNHIELCGEEALQTAMEIILKD